MQELKNIFYLFVDNISYYGILLLIFFAVIMVTLSILFLIRASRNDPKDRLQSLISNKKGKAKEDKQQTFLTSKKEGLATKISKPLHKISSIDNRSARQRLQLKLIRAGYRSDQAIYNLLAFKIISPIILVSVFLFTNAIYKFEERTILISIILLIFGFYLPNIILFLIMKTRQEKIFKGLPDALDLMVVCVESGLGIDMTFKRVGDEMKPLCKELSEEMTLTTLEIRAGVSREEAFKNMNMRVPISEVNSLMTVLIQTSRFGTSLAKALRVHADAMRTKRRQIAEETAAKSTVKMVFPLVLFIFPAIFVVLVGPGIIKIIRILLPAIGGG